MITDPLFYRLFSTSRETFFLLLGMSTDAANEMANRYAYEAIEFKETSHRTDGVFRPREAGLPLYFVEVQFYRLPSVFADLLAKAFTYLKKHDPGQVFQGVVLFATRSLEPKELEPYRAFLDAGVVKRYYLDEMPELADAPLGLAIMYLLRQTEDEAPKAARNLIARAKNEVADEALRVNLIQLIETVIIYKLANVSREEIQAMLKVDDIRETRVYKEAQEETREEERQRQLEEKLRAIPKMAKNKIAPEDIAEYLGLQVDFVREELAKSKA
jgi:predicted transposase/invertase (TIGR01784 family)